MKYPKQVSGHKSILKNVRDVPASKQLKSEQASKKARSRSIIFYSALFRPIDDGQRIYL